MSTINKWGNIAADNNVASPNGAQDNWTGEEINEWGRETMAQAKVFYNDPEFVDPIWRLSPSGTPTIVRNSAQQFTINLKNATAYLTAGRRIKIVGATTEYATVATSSYTTNTVVTVVGGVVPTTPTQVLVHNGGQLGQFAFGGYGTATQRDTKFGTTPNLPNGLCWYNTTIEALEIVRDNIWRHNLEFSDPDVLLNVYDEATGAVLQVSYKFDDEGALWVDVGSGFVMLARTATQYILSAAANTGDTGSDWVDAPGVLSGAAFPGTPNGVKQYRIEFVMYTDNQAEDSCCMCVGPTGDITDPYFFIAAELDKESGTEGYPPGGKPYSAAKLFAGSVVMTPASGDKVGLGLGEGANPISVKAKSHLTITEL
jgi:hypothetical protein